MSFIKSVIPSIISWIDKADSIIAISLEKTWRTFLFINLSVLTVKRSITRVINNTKKSAEMFVIKIFIFLVLDWEVKITEVIEAGPASRGIASGKIAVEISSLLKILFRLLDLLSKSISMEISKSKIPPDILNAYIYIYLDNSA